MPTVLTVLTVLPIPVRVVECKEGIHLLRTTVLTVLPIPVRVVECKEGIHLLRTCFETDQPQGVVEFAGLDDSVPVSIPRAE